MKKKIVNRIVIAAVVASFINTSSVYAAENGSGVPFISQEHIEDIDTENPDVKSKSDRTDNIVEIPIESEDTENSDVSDIKPDESEDIPEEPKKDEEDLNQQGNTVGVLQEPDNEINDTNMSEPDDKESCIGVEGEVEPYEMAQYARASTKPGKWIQASDGRWWYKHNDGTYTKNGWEYINGKWYYFDGSGWMKKGWIKVSNVWYYLNSSGAMVTGWQKISNTWYYFNSSGAMKTGWLQLSGKWYYLKSSGAMATGWTKVANTWYYMNSSGVMQTGWLTLGVKKYYLASSGAMRTGAQTIGGKKYYFVESGELGEHRNKKVEKSYYMTNFEGSRSSVRVTSEVSEDLRPETSSTVALVKRKGLLYYRSGGTAGFSFKGFSPRHFNSSNNTIKDFSWQKEAYILPSDTVVSMCVVNRTKVVYSNTNTNYSQLTYLLSGEPGIESGGVRSGGAKINLKK